MNRKKTILATFRSVGIIRQNRIAEKLGVSAVSVTQNIGKNGKLTQSFWNTFLAYCHQNKVSVVEEA